jgi:hypothetical protein
VVLERVDVHLQIVYDECQIVIEPDPQGSLVYYDNVVRALRHIPQPVVPELTGKQWSAMRTVIHEYAKKFRSADTYEMASAYMDAAPEAVYQALLSAGKGGE